MTRDEVCLDIKKYDVTTCSTFTLTPGGKLPGTFTAKGSVTADVLIKIEWFPDIKLKNEKIDFDVEFDLDKWKFTKLKVTRN